MFNFNSIGASCDEDTGRMRGASGRYQVPPLSKSGSSGMLKSLKKMRSPGSSGNFDFGGGRREGVNSEPNTPRAMAEGLGLNDEEEDFQAPRRFQKPKKFQSAKFADDDHLLVLVDSHMDRSKSSQMP